MAQDSAANMDPIGAVVHSNPHRPGPAQSAALVHFESCPSGSREKQSLTPVPRGGGLKFCRGRVETC